jgi:tetratricopeptide (TPR) repeat protein
MLDDIGNSQNPAANQIQHLVKLYNQGKLGEVCEQTSTLTKQYPNILGLWNLLGASAAQIGKLDKAIDAFNKAISIKPDYADAYNNLGNALQEQGKLEEAIEAYNKALTIKPNYDEAYNNMGNALKEQGKLDKAIEAFTKALSIQPDNTAAYNNMGNVLKDQGKPEEAIEAYNKAISKRPDYAEAYSNMGNVLKEQGKLDEAVEAYKKAISINPDYDDAYWNLSGTAENINEAKKSIKKCLEVDSNNLEAKLTKSALDFYEGDKSEFTELLRSPLKDHAYMRSFKWVFNLPKLPPLHFHRCALFDHMTELSKKDRPFYEFGVWRGEAFRYLIKTFKKGYGFDTFEGLPEDWHNEKAGTYSSDGNIPKIKGGEFIVGKFEDTLPRFFTEKRPMASIINFDADLYSSTICALNFAKPVIDKHTILIFDEFIINKNWEQDEYKALEEFCFNNKCTYEVLAVSFFTKQVAVKLDGI